ncbi:hypothetical protein IAQ61_011273 [Plenodomus lingam]|uniref:uncharacterized protein n=1 Tax=Leptosphaeria maculans TaxID=5022 RepID=UPI00332CFD61|nr:hypothetical protein IAQ61_011273 [Plenodomus lingam]
MAPIIRLTLFKLPDQSILDQAIEKYSTLTKDALKQNTPYIQSSSAHRLHDDARSQGYTLLARTVFASREDMDYFDKEDGAHGGLQAVIRPGLGEMPLVVYSDGV